ncbi:hypothetical protein PBI_DEWDROP_132 [Microbacterium phage Dewdrop]|nr:hypothetical protein PBI_LEAF_132 [Microbacterium phage Leaf]QGZ17500.1 hypothetical protein PBI_DEWDROP_132 [Microbacterium phage Dewdrop]
MSELELRQEIRFEPGHTIRKTKGDGKDYGIGSMMIRFLLHGPRATVQFVMSTGWVPEKVPVPGYSFSEWHHSAPTGFDVGYHADEPISEDMRDWSGGSDGQGRSCEYRPGGKCFYDGSGLAADALLERFMFEGHAAVWEELERYYLEQFHVVELTEVKEPMKEITS